jgi:hypothetical protein
MMQLFRNIAGIKILFLLILLAFSPVSMAAEAASSSLGKVVIPQPLTPANADQCVEPTEIMRRDHMNLLLHQRDETVLNGIRTKKYSLTGCIDCHAQPGENGKIVRAENPEYFCTACHQYTAVKIDCFECHSDQPSATARQISQRFNSPDLLATLDSTGTFELNSSRAHKEIFQETEVRGE